VGDESEVAVGLIAAHGRRIDRKQLPDLLGNRREHLFWWRPACHQRGDPPQCGLLLGQLTQPRLLARITANPAVVGAAP
jgi:hypothetical protein